MQTCPSEQQGSIGLPSSPNEQAFPAATHDEGIIVGIPVGIIVGPGVGMEDGIEVGIIVGPGVGIEVGIIVGGSDVTQRVLDPIIMHTCPSEQQGSIGLPSSPNEQALPAATHFVGLAEGDAVVGIPVGIIVGIGDGFDEGDAVGMPVGIIVGGSVATHLESRHTLSGEQHTLMGSPASSNSQIPPGGTHVLSLGVWVEVSSPWLSFSAATGIDVGLAAGAEVSFPAATGIDAGLAVGAEVFILISGSGTKS